MQCKPMKQKPYMVKTHNRGSTFSVNTIPGTSSEVTPRSEVLTGNDNTGSKKLLKTDNELHSSTVVLGNDDMLIEILLRLPLLSLRLFKSVSKHWLSLITSPDFTLRRKKITTIDPPAEIVNEHPILTTIELPRTFGGKLFESGGSLLLLSNDDIDSRKLNVSEMKNGCCEWSVKYIVNLNDIMMPSPNMWRTEDRVRAIVSGERKEDSFMIIHLLSKVVQYNPVLRLSARSMIWNQQGVILCTHISSFHLLLEFESANLFQAFQVLNVKVHAMEERVWSRNIKMALGAKLKLGFIDGTCAKPVVTYVNYQRTVEKITKRYGQSNGPLIYQLERELSHICQVSLSIASYFTNLKRCWDELQNLNGLPTCTCGKMRDCSCGILDKFLEIDSRSKLMQFLMKLSDEYKAVRSQILGMDPLPNINKACYIVQHIEKQKQVTQPLFEPTTSFVNLHGNKTGLKKGKKGTRMAAQGTLDEHMIGDTTFDMGFENGIVMGQHGMFDQKLVAAVCSEVMKMFKNKEVAEGGTTNANQASSSMHYAGIFSCFTSAFALLRYPGRLIRD
nr:hypothetical protein [Tanacetum cinerariifolium]